jgi:arylsulfatase A-like enzyme
MSVRFVFCAALLLAAAPAALPAADGKRRPNVLVILADDLGYGDVGFQGGKDVPTPHLDALARSGVRCTNGYVSGPYCSPTRAGLMTGRYQQRFGHEFNPTLLKRGGGGQGLPTTETTIAARLKAAGYTTGLIGKWHLGEEEKFHPLNRGFTDMFAFLTGAHSYLEPDDPTFGPVYRNRERARFKGYFTDVLGREACAFIGRNKGKPWFLYLAFNAVHAPLQAPDELIKKVNGISNPRRRKYLAMLLALDAAVGAVMGELKSAGLEEQTLIFFLSDNGGPIGKFAPNGSTNGPLRGSKGDTWEGGIRVPFVVSWKGRLPAGTGYDRPVISLDIHASALAAAGVGAKPEWKLDGVDLVPYLSGKKGGAPHPVLYWRFGPQMAVRQGDWKLVRPDRAVKGEFADVAKEPMLFNLTEDIGENNDLASMHPDKVEELQATWDKWNAELMRPRWPGIERGKPLPINP